MWGPRGHKIAKLVNITPITLVYDTQMTIWLVVEPYPSEKYESQLGLLIPIYGKIKNVPNHQLAIVNGVYKPIYNWGSPHCGLFHLQHRKVQPQKTTNSYALWSEPLLHQEMVEIVKRFRDLSTNKWRYNGYTDTMAPFY